MQSAETVLGVLRERGRHGLPCNELYRQMFNPELYLMTYGRIYSNKGAMTPGVSADTVDGMSLDRIERIIDAMRHERYRFSPVKRVMIPKKNGKLRPLGLPGWTDKLVGEVMRLLLEAYYDPQFSDRSHGFRARRGCHTALREVANTWTGTTWLIEGDISDCFGSLDHEVMLSTLSEKVHDRRFLRLLRNMLQAGYLEDWVWNATLSGAPQGGVLSPLLSNVALSVLDECIAQAPGGPAAGKVDRARRHRHGLPNYRLIRYADDWCLMVFGSKADAEVLREEIAEVLSTMGLRLSPEKTLITHIDEGLDFLGWHIQRHRKRGTRQHYVYTYPAKKAVQAVKRKVKTLCREVEVNQPLDDLLRRLNMALRGWCAYFRPGVSSVTFAYLSHYTWQTVWRWMRRKHRRSTWKELRHRYCGGGWWPASENRELFDPEKVGTTRYRYRGSIIPAPWPIA
ncbi:group II intron reverse transcriptase/maturase [Streptomyces adelaidensis]|uniref:group II intron reverse transcriptase/maturase n=1 Tax=Streptomyces adelaidensis TaxID=2796465 RepID=UPI00190903C0